MSDPLHRLIEAFQRGEFPFLQVLGVEPVEFGQGKATIRLVIEERHLRVGGIAHGGVAAGTLDTVIGLAAATLAPPGHDLVTAQLNINFVRPAAQGTLLTATAEVVHSGRKTAVVQAELRCEGKLIALATGTIIFLSPAV